jgi:hypothetical protein
MRTEDILEAMDELILTKKYMIENSPWMNPEYYGTHERQEMICKIAGYSQAIIDLGYFLACKHNLPELHERQGIYDE